MNSVNTAQPRRGVPSQPTGIERLECNPALGMGQQFSFWLSAGIERRLSRKALTHAIAQVIPTVKDPRAGAGPESVETWLASGEPPATPRGRVLTPRHHGVAQQGAQVEAAPHRGAGRRARLTGGLAMVALGLEPLGVCLVELPPPTACGRHDRDGRCRDALMGETARGGAWCTRGGVAP